MTTDDKKLLQAKHRLEEAEMRDRNKERKARTRRLIQEGAILEKVFPSVASMSLDDVEDFLCGLRRQTYDEGRSGNRASRFFYPEGRTYSPPRRGGGIACGNCALCEADAASAEALWTMPQLCGAAVIVHAVIASTPAVASVSRGTVCTPPCANCLRKSATGSFIAVMGIASSATPIFFLRKRNKNERTVETDGDLSFGSESGEPGGWTERRGSFRLSELFKNFERL